MLNEWLKHLARLYLPVYLYNSGKIMMFYMGYSSVKRNYYARMFLDTGEYSFIGRRWFWQNGRLLRSDNNVLVISEISPFALKQFRKYKGFIIPEWTNTRINIDRPIGEIIHRKNSDFSNVMRRIRKYNLTYEILTKQEDFEFFNEKIYIPYISKRYGEEALIDDLKKFWNSRPAPVIMAVKEEGRIVGASLVRKSEDSLFLLRVGLLDGNDEYRLHGVIGALYYFGIVEGQKMGCRYFDLGGTRPFLTDGLTKYKIGLGAEFVSDLSPQKEYLWLGITEDSVQAAELLAENAFMHVNSDFKLVKYSPGKVIEGEKISTPTVNP
jgi:hypothetical protein